MAEINEREILTPETLTKYMEQIYLDESLVSAYILSIEKETNGSLQFFRDIEASEVTVDEFEVGLLEELNISSFNANEILGKFPDNYRESILDLGRKFIELRKSNAVASDDYVLDFANPFFEEITKREQDLARSLSNYDLSLIPPSMYSKIKHINLVNFENTRANLDFTELDYNQRIVGSLKGCSLLSFDFYRYSSHESEDIYEVWIKIKDVPEEFLDVENYQVVIDAYRKIGYSAMIPEFLFKDAQIQKDNKWYFLDSFEKMKKASIVGLDAFSYASNDFIKKFGLLVPDEQTQYIDMLIENDILFPELANYSHFFSVLSKENGERYSDIFMTKILETLNPYNFKHWELDNFFNNIDVHILEKHREKLRESGWFNDTSEYVSKVWSKLSAETILSEFDEIYSDLVKYYNNLTKRDNNESLALINILSKIDGNIALKYISENFDFVLNCLTGSIYTFSDFNIELKNINALEHEKIYNILVSKFDSFEAEKRIQIIKMNFLPLLEYVATQEYMDKFLDDHKEDVLKGLWVGKGNALETFNLEIIQKYDLNFIKEIVLLEKKGGISFGNSKALIENLPNLGIELIQRVYNSNSEMIRTNFTNIIDTISILSKEDATKVVEKIENIFSQSTVPDFFKLYKYYDMVVDGNKELTDRVLSKERRLSPVLTATSSEKMYKKIILSDLMKISMDSNNKSMADFIRTLDEGNRIYSKMSRQNFDENVLSSRERELLQKYVSALSVLYHDSDSYRYDVENGRKLVFTGNLAQDAKKLGSRYCHDGITDNLADIVWSAYIGPYKEPFAEFATVSGMKKYMEDRVNKSNDRHKELAKHSISIQEGDLVKGVGGDIKIYRSVLKDGIRAGEFLGVDYHTDATPLDTDFAVVGKLEKGELKPSEIIGGTVARSYGGYFYAVVKHNPDKIEITRSNGSIEAMVEEDNMASRIENINEKSEIYKRLRRKNVGHENKKLEMFSSGVADEKHYGIRTGIGAADVDYFLTSKYDKRMGYEQAMSGMYIPIYDMDGGLLFSPEMFDEYRKQMQGLPYYDTPKFEVADTAFSTQTKEIVDELFPDEHQIFSVSEFEADKKRSAIQRKVIDAVASLGLGMEYGVTGNVTNGFVEFIDTGSTGRGTNLPNDGDFDFMMKVDKAIIDDSQKLEKLKEALREKLVTEDGEKAENEDRAELGGNFRYKNIGIEGLEEPVDIDITFVSKDDNLVYSTDMCVRERLNEIKKSNFEEYKYVIGNIVLAKQMLKKEGCYKKSSSSGSTEFGGFGGVGVENWILQNGGSFAEALDTFIEASDKAHEKVNEARANAVFLRENPEAQKNKDLEAEYGMFMELYPIFDFGENHMARGNYQHDSFIRGMTQAGYEKAKTLFRELRKELEVIPRKENLELEEKSETRFSESFDDSLNEAASQVRSADVMKAIDDIEKTYKQEINPSNEIGG